MVWFGYRMLEGGTKERRRKTQRKSINEPYDLSFCWCFILNHLLLGFPRKAKKFNGKVRRTLPPLRSGGIWVRVSFSGAIFGLIRLLYPRLLVRRVPFLPNWVSMRFLVQWRLIPRWQCGSWLRPIAPYFSKIAVTAKNDRPLVFRRKYDHSRCINRCKPASQLSQNDRLQVFFRYRMSWISRFGYASNQTLSAVMIEAWRRIPRARQARSPRDNP